MLRVQNEDARKWYLAEASKEHWSTRTLDRNINSQYYFRLLQSPKKDAVVAEMKSKTVNYDNDRLEFLKNPIVAEFLGLSQNNDFTETKLVFTTCCVSANFNLDGRKVIARILWRMKIMKI